MKKYLPAIAAGLLIAGVVAAAGASFDTTVRIMKAGAQVFGGLTLKDTAATNSITSDTTATAMTSSVAAVTISPTATPNANDLILRVKDSSTTTLFSVDLEGDVVVPGSLAVTGATTNAGVTIGATGGKIDDSYGGAFTIDFAGVTDVCEDSAAQTLTGAAVNDVCVVGAPATGPHANSWFTCYVSAANAVKVRHCAHGASGDLASGTYAVRVFDP